ncbi:MAG: family 16 glycoside hydrolase [Planctomycetota bacterium]
MCVLILRVRLIPAARKPSLEKSPMDFARFSLCKHIARDRRWLGILSVVCWMLMGSAVLRGEGPANSASSEAPPNSLTPSERAGGWQLLFDGTDFEGWRNYRKTGVSKGWTIQDGAMVRSEKGAGDLITQQQFEFFELSLEYKISPEGNSGLMFHVTEEADRPWKTGPEVQIQDNLNGHDPQKSGWLYQLYQPRPPRWSKVQDNLDATRPPGQWNQIYLRIAPNGCEVCLNGNRYYMFTLGSKDWNKRVAKSKFAKFEGFGKAGRGHLCLQDHGDEVAFRNIKLRTIDPAAWPPSPTTGKLGLQHKPAFPDLKWDQWAPFDEDGRRQELRLMEVTFAPKDTKRLFAAAQSGQIWVFENRPDVTTSKMFLDLRDQVYNYQDRGANEQGLLGLAFHPDYLSNGKFYTYHSAIDDTKSVITQWSVSADDPDRADPKSAKVLMEIPQPYQNHNGGSIEFGPDGFLYIGTGDGGDRNDPQGNGQNLQTLLGCILRIDVDRSSGDLAYGIPKDNPFVGNDRAADEIYAYGLRNPWRIAFDAKTGDLWCGDVGQELWEEINIIKKGGNYGWSIREGMHPFGNGTLAEGANLPVDPIWEYDHQVGKSITGGRVVRTSKVPALDGKYVYADYVSGRIWALQYDSATGKVVSNEEVIESSIPVLAFGQDAQGEVFFLTADGKGRCINRFVAPGT